MDLRLHIEKFSRRFAEVEAALSDHKAFDNPQRAQELGKEYVRLKELVRHGQAYVKVVADLAENRALLQTEPADSELAQMAKEEIARLEAQEQRLGLEIQRGILPPDPADSRNTIIEIRAGAGGQESALFAADLYRMYTRYAETRSPWRARTRPMLPECTRARSPADRSASIVTRGLGTAHPVNHRRMPGENSTRIAGEDQLLMDSIKAIDRNFDDSKRPE